MARYIEREKARYYLHKACEGLGGNGGMMLKIQFDEEPDADVKPVRYGEWIRARCSECGHLDVEEPDYCSRCGAWMHEKGREE